MAPHGCEDSAAIEISAFRRISGGADICRFLGLKKVLRQKTSKQNPEGSRRENRKNEKQIVAASYATRISAANQVTQLESKPRSKPQIKVDAKLPATNYYGRQNLSVTSHSYSRRNAKLWFSCLGVAQDGMRDSQTRRSYKLCDSAR